MTVTTYGADINNDDAELYNSCHVTDGRVYSLSILGWGYPVAQHFQLHEFRCHDGSDLVVIHPALPLLLEAIRAHFGAPVSIRSAYRSHSHNRNVGGTIQSRHLWGMAADIVVSEVPPSRVADYAETLGAGGVGRYSTFTHVDVHGVMRRWRG